MTVRVTTNRALPKPLRAFITLLATMSILFSGMTGNAFAASTSAEWDQYCNTGCNPGDWANGDLNGNNSEYHEGEVVPQRLLLTDSPAGVPIELSFSYSTARGSSTDHVSYDYLASWDASEGLTSDTIPLTPASRPIPSAPFDDEATIPLDPSTAGGSVFFHGTPLPDDMRKLQVQNAEIILAPTITPDGNFETGTSNSTMTFRLLPTGTLGSLVDVGVVFGTHISSRNEWDSRAENPLSPFGDMTTAPTAGGISGSSYHAIFGYAAQVLLDDTLDDLVQGGRDNQLKANDVLPAPSVSVLKRLADGQSTTVAPGDTVTYEIVASNAGDGVGTVDVTDTISGSAADHATITSMTIDDVDCTGGALPADSASCDGVSVPALGETVIVVVVTVEDIQAGTVCDDLTLNNVEAASMDESIGDDEVNGIIVDVVDCFIDIAVVKTLDGGSEVDAGDDVTYSIVATNTGNIAGTVDITDTISGSAADHATITSMTIDDVDCTDGETLPADSATCADVEVPADGSVTVEVTVSTDVIEPGSVCEDLLLDNAANGSQAATVTIVVPECIIDIAVVKTLDGGTEVDAGDDVTYSIVATNTGNIAGTVDITDTISGSAADHATITLMTIDDVDCTDGETLPADSATCADVEVPADGSVTVTVTVSTDVIEPGSVCEDLLLDNAANGSQAATVTIVVPECTPDVSVIKEISADGGSSWADANTVETGPSVVLPHDLDFRAEITNTGNVDLAGVRIRDWIDPEFDEEGAPILVPGESSTINTLYPGQGEDGPTCLLAGEEGPEPFDGFLAVGETVTCSFSGTAEAGAHVDYVEVVGCFPGSGFICPFPSDEDPTEETQSTRTLASGDIAVTANDPAWYSAVFPPIVLPPNVDAPSIDIVKQASATNAPIGSTVTYVYTVTNNGDVTLNNVELVDAVTAGSGNTTLVLSPANSGTSLAPGGQATFTSTHLVTQADIGNIVNVATASGTAPNGTTVTDNDDWTVGVVGRPGLALDKIADAEFITFSASGAFESVVTYTYSITNTGDVTLTNLNLDDDILGNITLATTTLAPGASTTATATHLVTALDAQNGEIINVAVVTGLDPTGAPVTATDTEEVFVAEVLPEIIERPEPAPAPEVLPEVIEAPAPEVLPATGLQTGGILAVGLLTLMLGMGVLLLDKRPPLADGPYRHNRGHHGK